MYFLVLSRPANECIPVIHRCVCFGRHRCLQMNELSFCIKFHFYMSFLYAMGAKIKGFLIYVRKFKTNKVLLQY